MYLKLKMEYTKYDSEYTTNPINLLNITEYKILYPGVSIMGLISNSRAMGYTLLELHQLHQLHQEHQEQKVKGIGMTTQDYKKHMYKTCTEVIAMTPDEKLISEIALITPDGLNKIKTSQNTSIKSYMLKRSLYPDDQTIRNTPSKKTEYELGRLVLTQLSDICVAEHQGNIGDYKADFIFKLKNAYFDKIPNIIFEIDENGHSDRDPEYEKVREQAMKHFTPNIYRVSADRKASDSDLKKIARQASEQIRMIFKDLALHYASKITPEMFAEAVSDYDIDREFLNLFW